MFSKSILFSVTIILLGCNSTKMYNNSFITHTKDYYSDIKNPKYGLSLIEERDYKKSIHFNLRIKKENPIKLGSKIYNKIFFFSVRDDEYLRIENNKIIIAKFVANKFLLNENIFIDFRKLNRDDSSLISLGTMLYHYIKFDSAFFSPEINDSIFCYSLRKQKSDIRMSSDDMRFKKIIVSRKYGFLMIQFMHEYNEIIYYKRRLKKYKDCL